MMKTGGIKILLVIFLLQIFALSILFFNSNTANAAEVNFVPQVSIPDSDFKAGENVGVSGSTATIAKYIKAIYQYGIGIVGILAAIVLMFGGLLWMTAGGETGRVTEAKEWIKASLLGLVIALSSYVILQTINPDLVNFRPIEVADIKNLDTEIDIVMLEEDYFLEDILRSKLNKNNINFTPITSDAETLEITGTDKNNNFYKSVISSDGTWFIDRIIGDQIVRKDGGSGFNKAAALQYIMPNYAARDDININIDNFIEIHNIE